MADRGAMDSVVQFGAGSVGRGFLGQVFSEAGLETVFVDVLPDLVAALDQRGSYPLRLVGPDRHERMTVAPVRAIDARDREQVTAALGGAALACTAVGVSALPGVAAAVAEGLRARARRDAPPLNILLCENQFRCADLFGGLVARCLAGEGSDGIRTGHARHANGADVSASDDLLSHLGLVETVVARMIPVLPESERQADALSMVAEDYPLLPVDGRAFLGRPPDIPALHPVDDIAPWFERKLYCHNTAHAVAAYLGYRLGKQMVHHAMSDTVVAAEVDAALSESGEALHRRHGFGRDEQRAYGADLIRRFRNPALRDTVARVGRDPLRKLRPDDRLVGALLHCLDQGVEPRGVLTGIAAALRFDAADDPSAAELQRRLREEGLDAVLGSVCGLSPGGQAAGMIRAALERLDAMER